MKVRIQILVVALVLLVTTISTAWADTFVVVAGHSEIEFNEATGLPVQWVVCQSLCVDVKDARRATLFAPGDGYIRTLKPVSKEPYTVTVEENSAAVSVQFRAGGRLLGYRLLKDSALVELNLPPGATFELATGESFVPEPLPGFGAIYSKVNVAQVDDSGQALHEYDEEQSVHKLTASSTNWTGIRSRYWTLLVQPVGKAVSVKVEYAAENLPELQLATGSAESSHQVKLYAGPIEWQSLKQVSPELSEMLFAALWDFLRVLTFGMLILLDWLYGLVGHYGLAIVLLSLSAKILMSPLTMLADRWQADVNRIHTLLKPDLDEIKEKFKGEEAHKRTLAVYKKHDISMLYTFKSAAGFLIQIPVFIAAFDMLAENIALNEMSFLWIANLAKPDGFAHLPFILPFFGGLLNLLPFLMTGLSVLAAWLQSEDTLSPDLQRKQSLRLYLMAAAFFILFYTFPAGMVLYWTSSNLFHLLKVESGRLFKWH
ncbi:MAG: membrane protein insertase YidC [Gammaproteobacteria bacterium]|nr:membrane protein insertase YidC [Gammaproteobacteria bacterium]MCP4091037.1 membrane protein insertase YidC [Gammaproteobacteria bacterium]MCP4277437.1 membrane protein insertase YidC [Gammaproteobacteria bacterium]MCP4831502.1 membrane protein insertase YidC [Gammaproteobacteria bacterium]MCP4927725.1 membrane protein insertase YidC [Gammaproteobacteria bacterium]